MRPERNSKTLDTTRIFSRSPHQQHSSTVLHRSRQFHRAMGSNTHPKELHPQLPRLLVQRRERKTHKHKGATSHSKNIRKSTERCSKSSSKYHERQQNSSVNISKTRIKSINNTATNYITNTSGTDQKKLFFRSTSHSGERSSPCRFPLSSRSHSSNRNSNIPSCIQSVNERTSSSSTSGSIFNKVQCKTSRIPFIDSRQKIQSNKHIHSRLEQIQNPVCIPSTKSNTQSNLQVEQGRPRDPGFNHTRLANQKLVFSITDTNKEEIPTPATRGRSVPNNKIRKTVLQRKQISFDRTSVIRCHIPKTFSSSLKRKLVIPTRKSTFDHYQIHWKIFSKFVSEKKMQINHQAVYEFFNHLIDKKLKYGSILQYRSAISRPLRYLLPKLDLLQDTVIKDLLQFTKSHQIKSNHEFPFWNLDRVIEMLSSPQFNSLCHQSHSLFFKKVLFLTLLASPKRIAEFHALSLSKSSFRESSIILRPHDKFIKKNATAIFNPEDIIIPKFAENKIICPVYNLQQYLEITSSICEERRVPRPDQLFIKDDTRPFTIHQLRSSIKEIIIRADPLSPKETSNFHSVRKIASTMLDYRGYSLQDIFKSMQWRSSQTYLKYYCQLGLVDPSTRGCVIAGKSLPST